MRIYLMYKFTSIDNEDKYVTIKQEGSKNHNIQMIIHIIL